MFCSKCGKEIPDESIFCPECGNNCKENKQSIPKVDVNEHKGYVIKSLCHPVNSVKEGIFGLSTKVQFAYIAIITFLIPFFKTIFFKIYSFNLVKSLFETFLNFSTKNNMSLDDMLTVKNQFDMIMENVFPTAKIYFLNLGSYVLNYVLILGLLYLIFKFLVRESINKYSILNIMFVVSIVNVFILILSAISLILGGTIWIIVSIFTSVLSIVLLYELFSSLIKSKNKLVYIYSATCMIAYSINIWFVLNNASSIIYSIYYNLNKYFI